MIRKNLSSSTKKYEFIKVVVAPELERDPNPASIPHRGIQQRHSFVRGADGSITTRDISCLQCIRIGNLCEECNNSCKVIYKAAHPTFQDDDDELEINVAEEDEHLFDEDVDISFSEGELDDEEGDEEANEEEEEEGDVFGPGAVCWAKLRSWYPAQICREEEIPSSMRRFLPKHTTDEFVVRRFEPCDGALFRVVKRKNLAHLGENEVDKFKAARSGIVAQAYNRALAKKGGKI